MGFILWSFIVIGVVITMKLEELIGGEQGPVNLVKIAIQPVNERDSRAAKFLMSVSFVLALLGVYSILYMDISTSSWLSILYDIASLVLFYVLMFSFFLRKKIRSGFSETSKNSGFRLVDVWRIRKNDCVNYQDEKLLFISNLLLVVNVVVIIVVAILK